MQGAALGLMGLMLGFSFAGASSRFVERQDLIVREANAIGSAREVFALVDPSLAAQARGVLGDYARLKLEQARHVRLGEPEDPALDAQLKRVLAQLWALGGKGAEARPTLAAAVVRAVQEVDDLHTLRDEARRRHMPGAVLALLIASAALGVATIGYGSGLSGRRNLVLAAPLALLTVASLWTTIDLDFPRVGLIRVDDGPLRRAAEPGP